MKQNKSDAGVKIGKQRNLHHKNSLDKYRPKCKTVWHWTQYLDVDDYKICVTLGLRLNWMHIIEWKWNPATHSKLVWFQSLLIQTDLNSVALVKRNSEMRWEIHSWSHNKSEHVLISNIVFFSSESSSFSLLIIRMFFITVSRWFRMRLEHKPLIFSCENTVFVSVHDCHCTELC